MMAVLDIKGNHWRIYHFGHYFFEKHFEFSTVAQRDPSEFCSNAQ